MVQIKNLMTITRVFTLILGFAQPVMAQEDVLNQAAGVFSGLLGQGAIITMIVVGGLIIGGMAFFIMHVLKYKIPAFVVERQGDGVVESRKRAGIITDKESGVKQLVVKTNGLFSKKHMEAPVPDKKFFHTNHKGKKFLRIYQDGEESCKIIPPIKPSEVSERAVDMDWLNWGALSLKGKAERFRKKQSFMDKYGTLMGFGMVAIVFVFISIFWFQDHTKSAQALASMSQNNKEVSENYLRMQEIAVGVQSVPTREGGNLPLNSTPPDPGGGG